MLKGLVGLIDRLFAVIGALAFSQFPLFIQQYQQNLLGHVEELKIQLQAMQSAASVTGKSLQQYIVKFLNSADTDFQLQGALMNNMVERYYTLNDSFQALQEASIYFKPFLFIKYGDWKIAKLTWQSYKIGISFTSEGAIYAGIGVIVGVAIYGLLSKLIKGLWEYYYQAEEKSSI
ncbi:Uncharacterized protein DB41_GD00030 [Neochlamydia sp. TUME1]|uniref:DUF2937 family protein n=1 Tax=Neochlamydia sp. TUME1 TaxID=1478174 RepID=UPI00058376BD|nr:DUF2937 family protein [Neochlamydia sp. TUME1]KIC76425.1 Uncharacterized protein DB41_GD00030 [Neochlamydia sp. TUME1]